MEKFNEAGFKETYRTYTWVTDRESILLDLHDHIAALLGMRTTGVFAITVAIPNISTEEEQHQKDAEELEKTLKMFSAYKAAGYYCCTADFGKHEPTCKNYPQLNAGLTRTSQKSPGKD